MYTALPATAPGMKGPGQACGLTQAAG